MPSLISSTEIVGPLASPRANGRVEKSPIPRPRPRASDCRTWARTAEVYPVLGRCAKANPSGHQHAKSIHCAETMEFDPEVLTLQQMMRVQDELAAVLQRRFGRTLA